MTVPNHMKFVTLVLPIIFILGVLFGAVNRIWWFVMMCEILAVISLTLAIVGMMRYDTP